MKRILEHLNSNQRLKKSEAKRILIDISNSKYSIPEVASFISVFLMRDISVKELSGFRSALLELCKKLNLECKNTIDLCGTGGDGKDTFNISTLSSFVVAGADYKVTKHGNYGVSSVCGSSNVLEYLGYTFTNEESRLNKQLDRANICFLHAPLFHPAMKFVAPIRKSLGVKTFFNMLGPLVNPARPKNQMVGVFNLEVLRLYNYLFESKDINYKIVHSFDGYDEISLTSPAMISSRHGNSIIQASDFNFESLNQTDIYGGKTIKEAARIFMNVLKNKGSEAQEKVVLVNSALAINTIDEKLSLEECFEKAKESLLSSSALNSFSQLIAN